VSFHPNIILKPRRDDCIVTLPLWSPSVVKIGSVGYLRKPEGEFVTLFNAFDPPQTSGGVLGDMANLSGYGRVSKGSQRQDKRSRTQKGLDALQSWYSSKILCVNSPVKTKPISQLGVGMTPSTDDIRSTSGLTAGPHSCVSSRRCTIMLRNCLPLRGGSRPMLMKS